MPAQRKDTQFSFRINAEFLEQARQRCQQEGVSLAEVITAALQDFVDYGTTRPPPECQEEEAASFF
jgi:predicted HicB family RNase H-like nuclease